MVTRRAGRSEGGLRTPETPDRYPSPWRIPRTAAVGLAGHPGLPAAFRSSAGLVGYTVSAQATGASWA